MKIGIITIKPNKKFMKFAKTVDMGKNSLEKVNCDRSWALLTIDGVASDKEVEKNTQGKMAHKTNRGKFSNSIFITYVKIKLIAAIMSKGVMTAQETPRIEPTYLAFSSFTTKFFNTSFWERIL